jgi:hypothetical protein
MAVSLVTYPVITSSGKVRNIFAGFAPVELEFKREDIQIVSISSGTDNRIVISVSGDITGSLSVNEWIYYYAEGTTHTYEGVFQVYDINYSAPNTLIELNEQYIEAATTGYVNYKQNWYLESKLVSPDNSLILKYPQVLQNDGSPDGVVEVNTSMIVDFLENQIETTSQEITDSRDECLVMYREVWREDDTQSFTLVDQEFIIIIYAAEDSEIESFVNKFDYPRMYEGYPFMLNMLHSLENESAKRISITFDEQNINGTDITNDNPLINFENEDFGILQANFADNVNPINSATRFITFNMNSISEPDYLTGDYNDNDYLTINTP